MANEFPLQGVRVAMTVDDSFQWTGVSFPDGYSAHSVTDQLLRAFDEHRVPGSYLFNNTAPVDNDSGLLKVFDDWCEAGHHVGNHTHHHASLNWVTTDQYIRDIDTTEKLVAPWVEQAPDRYFRFAFDMWGDHPEKTGKIQTHLVGLGYKVAPVSYWFYDAQFMVAYNRALELKDTGAQQRILSTLAKTAVSQLRNQAAAAKAALGRVPDQIGLIHGTPVGGDGMSAVLAALAAEGVEFITMDEAMKDPANSTPAPLTQRKFRNATQKWAEVTGVEVADTPPAVLADIEKEAVIEGKSYNEVIFAAMGEWGKPFNTTPVPEDFH